jgi:hypothetical protein
MSPLPVSTKEVSTVTAKAHRIANIIVVELKDKAAAAAGVETSKAQGATAEVAGEAKGKAAELKGQAKGKIEEVKGKM